MKQTYKHTNKQKVPAWYRICLFTIKQSEISFEMTIQYGKDCMALSNILQTSAL